MLQCFKSLHGKLLWQQILILNYYVVIYGLIMSTNTFTTFILMLHLISFSLFMLISNIYTKSSKLRYILLDLSHRCLKIIQFCCLFSLDKYLIISSIILLLTVQIAWIIYDYKCPMMMFYTDDTTVPFRAKFTTPLATIIQIIKLLYLL